MSPESAPPFRVLLVDDNPGDAELLRRALSARAELEWLRRAEDVPAHLERALADASRQLPHLLLLDLKMPRMGGLELLQQLKTHDALRALPVVILTSSQAPADVRRAYELGAAACFSKPAAGFESLMTAVLDFFGGAARQDWENLQLSPQPAAPTPEEPRVPMFPTPVEGRGPIEVTWDTLDVPEQLCRLAIEGALYGLLAIEESGRIRFANATAARMFGYGRDELIGTTVEKLVPDQWRNGHAKLRAKYGGSPIVREMGHGRYLYAQRKDGSVFPVEVGLNPIRAERELVTLCTVVDITYRRQTEESLAAQQRELARSNEELEQFAYVASHDLQEPLRMVSSFTRLLADHLGDGLDPTGQEFLTYVQDGSARMRTLIQDLLAYSRVRSGKQELSPVKLAECLDAAQENLTLAIRESGAVIEANLSTTALGDESQLTAVFQNLVSNAIKFRSSSAPRVRIADRRDGDVICVDVADDGIGIAPEHQSRIFQLFERLHTREEYPGTGIGLALCQRIVERHGGTLRVHSDGAAGSTFSFTLRAADTR
ncbi:MAG: ATP-binding protein [Polyangiaceae bacterium]